MVRIPHTQCEHRVAFSPILEPTNSLSLAVVERPEMGLRDLGIGIGNLSAAPMPVTRELKTTVHMQIAIPVEDVTIAHMFGGISLKIDEALQFIDACQSPV